jgi:hypothetical protein
LHQPNQSLWRSFGLVTMNDDDKNLRSPGLIDWIREIEDITGESLFPIIAVGMKDDGNATSQIPVDEVVDSIFIDSLVLSDLSENGWVTRINDTVEETKTVISKTYRIYLDDIKEIRNLSNSDFSKQMVELLYFKIDQPFRQWLSSIQMQDDKDAKIKEWRQVLKKVVKDEAKSILQQGGTRDYIGIEKDGKTKNIATAYSRFSYWIWQQLGQEEKHDGTA